MDKVVAELVFGLDVFDNGKTIFGKPILTTSGGHNLKGYSTDIAAAWEVVDCMVKANGKENKFHLYRFGFGVKKPKIVWRCAWGEDWANLLNYCDAETAPLAICRAALKVLSSQE